MNRYQEGCDFASFFRISRKNNERERVVEKYSNNKERIVKEQQ